MKLALIGGGVMGEAIVSALLRGGIAQPGEVAVCEIVRERREELRQRYGVAVSEGAAEALAGAQVALLAVKPQEFPQAARELAGALRREQTVMSIMAGIRIATLRDALRHDALVRAIPNTPAQIGEGMTVWTATPEVGEAARESVRRILSALGQELYVPEEKYVDMATAVSASGPAYVFLVAEALIDAAVHIGLRRELAEPMVLQTILGSVRYAQEAGRHPAELRNRVTSPGGTTAEGLLALERAGVRAAFVQAVREAYEKALRLGG